MWCSKKCMRLYFESDDPYWTSWRVTGLGFNNTQCKEVDWNYCHWLWDGTVWRWHWSSGEGVCCRPWYEGNILSVVKLLCGVCKSSPILYLIFSLSQIWRIFFLWLYCHGSQIRLHQVVNPNKAIADYRTEITGLSAEDLDGVTLTLKDVQVYLL